MYFAGEQFVHGKDTSQSTIVLLSTYVVNLNKLITQTSW